MSSWNRLSVLALASTVFATPYNGHKHGHVHRHLHGSGAPFPYPTANGTGIWGSTDTSSCTSSTQAPSYSQAPSASQIEESSTSTLFQTVYQTVSYAEAPSSSAGAVTSAGGYGSGDQCAQDVTVTSTEKVYVTITAGQAPSSSESSPVDTTSGKPTVYTSSSAPGSYGSSPTSSAPAYSAPSSSSSESSPVYSSSSSPAYSAPASSSASSHGSSSASSSYAVFPTLSTYSPISKLVASTTSSAPSSSSSTSSSSGGKRGLAYNSADLTTCFDGSSEVSWAYNWVSASAGLTGNLQFIPTLHDGSTTFTSVWDSEASASIASGSKTLFSFNEPDESSQANMSPEAAAEAYIQYMNPFAGKANLCAPSVTNGPADENMGLTWLQQFIDACGDKCHIDCYSIHWYAPADAEGFKEHVTSAISMAGDKPVWVSEFGCTGNSDDEVTSFLEEVMPWMDSNDSIAGYAYYMVSDGMLVSGDQPSSYGSTYKTYTG